MFQLVVAVMSIFMVTGIALVGLYASTNSYTESSRRAQVAVDSYAKDRPIERDLPMGGTWTTGASIR